MLSRTVWKALNAFFQFRGIRIGCASEAIFYFPSLNPSTATATFAPGDIRARLRVNARDMILGLILLARAKIGAGHIELRGRFVERLNAITGSIFSYGPGKFPCANHKSPRWWCNSSSTGKRN